MAVAINNRQAQQCNPDCNFHLIILNSDFQPYGLIFQWDSSNWDPLLIIERVFLSYQFGKMITAQVEMFSSVIMKGRQHLIALSGKEPTIIVLPVTMQML